MKYLPLLFALLLPSIAPAEPVWKQDGNKSIELVDGDTTLVRFLVNPAPRDPHFEVLATKEGHNTVWVGPADHVWHYGLWFSWKKINKVNFWETNKETGEQEGRNEILDAKVIIEEGADTAIVRYREMAHPDREGEAVLEDQVEIRITRPKGDLGVRVDWDIKTTALADVQLDRTPPPGAKDKTGKARSFGGYGGFSWRGPGTFRDVVYFDSEGRKDKEIHRKDADWVNVNVKLEPNDVGLLIVDHPDNPRDRSSWYVYHVPRRATFWYVNPALLQWEAMNLKKGESFTHRYRVQLHDGSLNAEECKQLAAQLVE